MTVTITFELPLSATAEDEDGITVDALFTALDHASAYHDHDGNYAEYYDNLGSFLKEQAMAQLEDN